MCSNEVLRLLLFNLWGIALDVASCLHRDGDEIGADVHIPFRFGIDRLAFPVC